MKVIFLTGNKNKLKEIQDIVGESINLTNKKIDLPEIQSTNVEEVIEEKLKAAYKIVKKPVFCEDTGVYIKNMNNFPGALIKFYMEHLGNKGIAKFNGGSKAYAETIIGYHDGKKIHYFKGRINGTIAKKPKGKGFGWDPIFIPNRYKESFAEMSQETKNKISMRAKAVKKFKKHLLN
jgi:non-canonical purine NTP pyrophosphatase (RdgB/HAM1 family)